jgi:hypothetical protein
VATGDAQNFTRATLVKDWLGILAGNCAAGDAVADRVGFRSVFWLWVAVAIDARYHDLAERLCRLGRAYWNHPNRVPPPESAVLTAR